MELTSFSFDRDIRPRNRQKRFDWVPLAVIVIALFLIALYVQFGTNLTDVAHAQGISRAHITEDYDGETLEMCEKFLLTH